MHTQIRGRGGGRSWRACLLDLATGGAGWRHFVVGPEHLFKQVFVRCNHELPTGVARFAHPSCNLAFATFPTLKEAVVWRGESIYANNCVCKFTSCIYPPSYLCTYLLLRCLLERCQCVCRTQPTSTSRNYTCLSNTSERSDFVKYEVGKIEFLDRTSVHCATTAASNRKTGAMTFEVRAAIADELPRAVEIVNEAFQLAYAHVRPADDYLPPRTHAGEGCSCDAPTWL